MTTRRWFLLLLLAALAFLLWKRSLLRHILSSPARKARPSGLDRGQGKGKSLVAVASEGNVESMIRTAVFLIGGFGPHELRGKAVLVKPNVVSSKPSPATTSPEVVKAVTKILYEEGARKVYVGDMSAALTFNTLRNMEETGIKGAAEEAGAEVVAFEDYGWTEMKVERAPFQRVIVTEWIEKVDFVVNLPVVKTHRSASYSICLKNFVGCTHVRQRPYLIDRNRWEEIVAELNLAYEPGLNIVDGTVSMIEGGPWEGTSQKTGLIIASTDRVAADVVGLGLIKTFGRWDKVTGKGVWEQRQIRRALELGLGRGRENILLLAKGEGEEFARLMERIREITGLDA